MTRDELLKALRRSREQMEAALDGLSEADMQTPGVVGEWSVKDVLAHITAWEVEMLTTWGKARRGAKVKLDQWTEARVQAQNAQWYANYKDRPLERVLADFDGARRQTVRQVEGLSDRDLAAVPPWLGKPLADYVYGDSARHEAEHAAQIQAWRQGHTRPETQEGR